jgi:predicted metalloprotease
VSRGLGRRPRRAGTLAVGLAAATLLAACTTVVDGRPVIATAANAHLNVIGNSGGAFDTTVQNALADVTAFWKVNYPKLANGKSLPPLTGGLYSIDGDQVVTQNRLPGPAAAEACLSDDPSGIVDNAFYCADDDSIVWDRAPNHLVPALGTKYGPILVAMVFAHEFGHAIQKRLGILDQNRPTIDTESQADCASGAFLASVLAGQAPHFRVTADQLDEALNGYLLVRDKTPTSAKDISHGNGFDRLSAVDDGIRHGVTYCYSSSYFSDRQFTERPFATDTQDGITDAERGGNQPLSAVLDAGDPTQDSNAGGLQPNLNKYWTAAAKTVSKPFTAVKIAEAAQPKCGAAAGSQFGYCPDDNTVYYSSGFAKQAYYSLASLNIDSTTAEVSVLTSQPADYALGTLFAIGWGLAVRHQVFDRSTTDQAALLGAVCYAGAYSKSINVADGSATATFTLSPPDMDEATSAVLNLVDQPAAYGARGTTGLQRIQSFVTGYNGGLSSC